MERKPIKTNLKCFLCLNSQATHQVQLRDDPVTLNLCLCPGCQELPESILMSHFKVATYSC